MNVSKVCTVSGSMFMHVTLVSDKYSGRLGKKIKCLYAFNKDEIYSSIADVIIHLQKKKKKRDKIISFPVSKCGKRIYVDGCGEAKSMG